jgi:hypothetical protein
MLSMMTRSLSRLRNATLNASFLLSRRLIRLLSQHRTLHHALEPVVLVKVHKLHHDLRHSLSCHSVPYNINDDVDLLLLHRASPNCLRHYLIRMLPALLPSLHSHHPMLETVSSLTAAVMTVLVYRRTICSLDLLKPALKISQLDPVLPSPRPTWTHLSRSLRTVRKSSWLPMLFNVTQPPLSVLLVCRLNGIIRSTRRRSWTRPRC